MIVSLEAAAHEAALEDGVLTGFGQNRNDDIFKSKKASLRRGKWTTEEESYANRLIYEFKLGLLPLTDGTTLRTFLSKLLNCDPMRISKKFVGVNCIGKQVFRRRQQDLEKLSVEQIERSRKELSELERRFLERVAQTNRTRGAPKEGRMAGYDEEGGLAPWMIQPEDNDQMSVSSSSASSSIHQSNLSGQALVQQRLQQQQQLGQFQNGYQNFNSLDYGYNQQPNFPKHIDNGYNQRMENQMHDNSSVISKENSLVKVKAGKITSGLYGGGGNDGGNSMISKEQAYIDNNSKPNNRLHDYYYDGASNHSNQHNSNNSNKSSLVHSINGMKIDDPNNLNRVNSLEMLCSLDMLKFSQNQSLDNMANFVIPSSQVSASFPWYGNTSSDNVGGMDVNPNHNHMNNNNMNNNNNNNNNSFDNNMKISASSVSLSDFAMSLWPSMNNLVTAAEAALSNNHNVASDHQQFNASPVLHKNINPFKMSSNSSSSSSSHDDSNSNKNKIKGYNNLGSLTKLQSLSNVALDELEAIATLEEENKTKEQNQSNLNENPSHATTIKIESQLICSNNSNTSNNSNNNSNPVFSEVDRKFDIQSMAVVAEVPAILISDDKVDLNNKPVFTIPSDTNNTTTNNNTNNNNNGVIVKVEKLDTIASLTNSNMEEDMDKMPMVTTSRIVGINNTTTTNHISPVMATTSYRSKLDSAPTNATAISHPSSMSMMPMPNQLRHNSSVENFWMLVNMGDLPQPDNDVLSETLWPSMHQTHHDGDDNSTVKSMHSQNSHGSRKRNLGESDNNSNTSNSVNYNNNKPTSNDLSRMQGSSNSSQVSAVSAMTGTNEHKTKVKKILQIAALTKNNTPSSINNKRDDNEYNTDSHQYNNQNGNNTSSSSSNGMNEIVTNQMPFANDNNSFNTVLNSVKSVTNNNNQDVTENNGREAIFSSQLQKLYFPSNNSNQKGDHINLNSTEGNITTTTTII